MKTGRTSTRLLAALVCGSLFVAACSDDKKDDGATDETTVDSTGDSTVTTDATETTIGEPETWAVDTADCIDPAAADELIEGTIKIGAVMPLTGDTSADEAFSPVVAGWQAYMDYANETGLLGDVTIEHSVEDDQYNKDLTPGAVSSLIDAGVQVFSGILGSPNNLAVRDTLNEECIPQLGNLTGLPAWGTDVADYPWTTGQLVPYTVESRVYMQFLKEQFPEGATVALFYVNSDFGQSYADVIKAEGAEFGLEIVAEETIEPTDSAPPAGQLTTIAAAKPDAIISIPLGAGCISYLAALAEKKAQTAGWEPMNIVTNTCASALILAVAGANGTGLYTSNNLLDVADPANAALPQVKAYLEFMDSKGLSDKVTTATAGWNTAETTVAIIKQAQESEAGLTRASIINAARNFEYTPSMGRPGVVFKMNGEADAFLAESLQVLQWDAGTSKFTPQGDLITDFETA
ncbi:MAG: ABC transporter substrate-binding protein [Actinomycetota bacterium]|nr:ABC transporter substrate-binding protein [Actinomycetota bacterium]